MSNGIEFDDDKGSGMYQTQRAPGAMPGQGEVPKMAEWLMKHGIVSSPNAAQGVLVGIIVINIAVVVFVIAFIL